MPDEVVYPSRDEWSLQSSAGMLKHHATIESNPGTAMKTRRTMQIRLMVAALVLALAPWAARAQSAPPAQTAAVRDGQHDFDFEIGAWKTHLKRLLHPLSGSTTWIEMDGTSVVRPVLGGRANLVELDVSGAGARIEGASLRLYNPQSRQWSLNYASAGGGTLTAPVTGEFKNGRGEFYGQDTLNGRFILVRFVISDITSDSCRFEQAFSDDGGKTWEVNWIAVDTRAAAEPIERR